jgi:hypothetical protein
LATEPFAIAPEQEGTALAPGRERAWRAILRVMEERTVGNKNTITGLRPHFVSRL